MERPAFSRVKSYLDSALRSKWIALTAGAAAGLCYVVLVFLFALLIDLLDTRGRIPNFAQLGISQQEQFVDTWRSIPDDARAQAIQQVGYGEFNLDTKGPASISQADKRRFEAWKALNDLDNLPPLPGRMSVDDLKKWAQNRSGDQPYVLAMREYELRWRAYLWLYLRDHVGAEAADSLQPRVNPGDPLPVPGLGEENRSPHGVLCLVVRLRGTLAGKLLNGLASFNPWMWRGSDNRDPNQSYLAGLLILAIIAAVAAATCMIIMNWHAGWASIAAVLRLRRAIYHHSSRLNEATLHTNGTPEARGVFTKQVEAIHEALYLWLTTVSRYPAQILLLMALAAVIQPLLALGVILFAVLIYLLGGLIVLLFRRSGRNSSKFAASRLALMHESVKLMRLVKAYSMDLFNQSRVERQLSEYSKAHWARYRSEAFVMPLLTLLIALTSISVLYVAGRMVLSEGLSLSGLTIFVVAVAGLYPPIKGWQYLNRHLRRGRDASVSLFEFLDRKEVESQVLDAEFLQPMAKSLEFKDVSLRQAGRSGFILSDVNIKFKAGEKVGIMGADAEVKRAFLGLISRIHDPADGEVRIDGRNLKWVTPESLRAQIGLVMQSHLIFNDTVANNIGCGDPGITLPRIIEAAKIAHAHQFIQKLPYGYETTIGDLGRSLRVGEQFRIALARAIVRDPAIYIVEEPEVALDDDTKALLDDTFLRVLPGKTAFFLPHRISTLKHCDQIILLHNGTIEAAGTHRDLVNQSSLYKHLYYLQFNAFAEQV